MIDKEKFIRWIKKSMDERERWINTLKAKSKSHPWAMLFAAEHLMLKDILEKMEE